MSSRQLQRSVQSNVDEAMLKQMANSKYSNFYQTRLYGGLLFLEAIGFFMKARQEGAEANAWDLATSGLVVTAAGTRLLAAGAELAATSFNEVSRTAQAGQLVHGGLRLASGTLAAVAGEVWVGMDIASAGEARQQKQNWLMAGYYARAASGAALIAGEGGMAMAASKPFWETMVKKATARGWTQAVGYFSMGANVSAKLASKQAQLILGRILKIGGPVVFGATIAIEVLSPDALEAWCDRSVYRKGNGDGYDDQEEEMTELLVAIELVTR